MYFFVHLQTAAAEAQEEKAKKVKDKKKKKKRKPREAAIVHEDECFRCGEGGELVLCDRKNCTKAYHLKCLDLDKAPYGECNTGCHNLNITGEH